MSDTLSADEPAMLVTLVGLERALEGLADALTATSDIARATHVEAAGAAVGERLHRLRRDEAAADVVAAVEGALVTLRASQTWPRSAPARRAAEGAVARAHATVRAEVLEAQRAALAWSRTVDRQIAWVLKLTAAVWIALALAGAAVALALLRHRRRARRRLRRAEAALSRSEELAGRDPLTGLANRRRLARDLDDGVRTAANGAPFALHLFDVDGLKAVNDRWGHEAGDTLLAAVAAALVASVRGDDVVARLAGDEFAVLQRHATPQNVGILAARAQAAVARPLTLRDGSRVVPGVSVGIALYGVDGTTPAALLRAADDRLYDAKRARGGAAARARAD